MKDLMKNKAFRILSVALAVLIVAGGVTGVVYASASPSGNAGGSADTLLSDGGAASKPNGTSSDAVPANSGSNTNGKEETVYVIADAAGKAQKVIVSEWLKNPERLDTINDYTELSDIVNTNGDEAFTASGSNNYVWSAGGSDIHYQGTTQKQLPVSVSVSYFLDGKAISPEELAGKSGHIKIRFDYTNTQKTNADINGTSEQVCVPFLMASGVMLDLNSFSNVTVSSGQIINDGSRDVVVGVALPGVSQSLDLPDDTIDIPESVEIEADTTGFSLDATLTFGMTGLLGDLDLDSQTSIQDLSSSIDDLVDATLKLMDGSSDLYDGTCDLYGGSEDLENGAAALLSGAKDLSAGAAKANTGAASLRDGLGTLSKSSGTLNSGAKSIIDSVFDSATAQLRQKLVSSGLMTDAQAAGITLTSSNYVSVFKQLSSAVTVTPAQVEAQLRGKLSAMTADQQSLTLTIAYDLMAADKNLNYTDAVTQAASMMSDAAAAQAACAGIDAAWLADPSHQALIATVKGATGTDDMTAAKIAAIALALDPSSPAGKISAAAGILTHASIVASTTVSADKITALCTAVANAATSTGNASLDAVKSKLDDVMKFYNGLLIYTAGVDTAYAGSKDLAGGTSSLKDGASKLYDGVYSLYAGSKKLVSGAGDLKSGAQQLKDGLSDYYNEGIKKLSDALNGDLKGLLDRLRAMVDAGQDYASFAGKPGDLSGSVKFIYRTDAVE